MQVSIRHGAEAPGWRHSGSSPGAGRGRSAAQPGVSACPSVSPSHDTPAKGAQEPRAPCTYRPTREHFSVSAATAPCRYCWGAHLGCLRMTTRVTATASTARLSSTRQHTFPVDMAIPAAPSSWRLSGLSGRRLPAGEVDLSRQFWEGGPTAVGSAPSLTSLLTLKAKKRTLYSFFPT